MTARPSRVRVKLTAEAARLAKAITAHFLDVSRQCQCKGTDYLVHAAEYVWESDEFQNVDDATLSAAMHVAMCAIADLLVHGEEALALREGRAR